MEESQANRAKEDASNGRNKVNSEDSQPQDSARCPPTPNSPHIMLPSNGGQGVPISGHAENPVLIGDMTDESRSMVKQPTMKRLDSTDATFCLHRSPSLLLENGLLGNMGGVKHPRKGVGRWALPAGSPLLRTTSSIPSLSSNSSGSIGFWAEIDAGKDASRELGSSALEKLSSIGEETSATLEHPQQLHRSQQGETDSRTREAPRNMKERSDLQSRAVDSRGQMEMISHVLMKDKVTELEGQSMQGQSMLLQMKLNATEEKSKARERENSHLRSRVAYLEGKVRALEHLAAEEKAKAAAFQEEAFKAKLEQAVMEKRREISMKRARSLIIASADTTLKMSKRFFPPTKAHGHDGGSNKAQK